VAAARGDYVAFLDSDDFWLPDKLALQVAELEAAPALAGFCYTGVELRRCGKSVEVRRPTLVGDCHDALLVTNPIHAPTSSGLVRREVFEAVGGFDPGFPAIEDWEWLIRVARLYRFTAIDATLTIYADDEGPGRRSRLLRSNLTARAMLWERTRHALRRIGAGHLFLLESARRELREDGGDPTIGRSLVLHALAERPQRPGNWLWLAYAAMPTGLRRWLRQRDAAGHARRKARHRDEIRPD
jgi:glycosyltransferase involved in cell wall biosynthesis